MKDIISANASLENMRQNMDMKRFAKEVLLEENYKKFMKPINLHFGFNCLEFYRVLYCHLLYYFSFQRIYLIVHLELQ